MKSKCLALGLLLEDYSTELGTNSTFGKQTDFSGNRILRALRDIMMLGQVFHSQGDCKVLHFNRQPEQRRQRGRNVFSCSSC